MCWRASTFCQEPTLSCCFRGWRAEWADGQTHRGGLLYCILFWYLILILRHYWRAMLIEKACCRASCTLIPAWAAAEEAGDRAVLEARLIEMACCRASSSYTLILPWAAAEEAGDRAVLEGRLIEMACCGASSSYILILPWAAAEEAGDQSVLDQAHRAGLLQSIFFLYLDPTLSCCRRCWRSGCTRGQAHRDGLLQSIFLYMDPTLSCCRRGWRVSCASGQAHRDGLLQCILFRFLQKMNNFNSKG
jgi:hypothetical protein